MAVGQRQLQMGQLFRGLDSGQGTHGLLATTQVGTAACALGLHLFKLARNVGRGSAQALQLHGVEGDLHLAGHPAHAHHRAHTLHAQQAARDGVVHKPAQRFVIHLGRADGERQNGRA